MQHDTLKQALNQWTDIDYAAFCLAISLGIMKPDVSFPKVKGIFWSVNPLGDAIIEMLDSLTEADVLQKRDEPDFQYRWNPNFRGSWEDHV